MLDLRQTQTQTQKLSPQQIQYIKLLQLPTLALEQRIKAELESNPLLEEGEEEDDEDVLESNDDESLDDAETQSEEEERLGEEIDADEEFDLEELLNDPDGLDTYQPRRDYSAEEEEREMPMPARVSMAEHLEEQVALLDFDSTEELIAEQIIGSIDEDGYLRRPLESIIDDIMFNYGVLQLTEQDVERVLKRIQRLDPVGIAARDLRECLLIQLTMMPANVPGRNTAIAMLQDAYKAFTMKHFDAIKKKLDIDDEALKEAYDLIQRLDPKPGEGEFSPTQNYITPDFTVRFIDGEFIITLNGRNAPELRISKQYRQMLQQLSAEQKNNRRRNGFDAETRQFLKSKMESARWFINSINQRRHTMMKVMHAIVEVQEDFFKFGEGYLKPMILKDVAERIDMDISTVSRVVNGKYVQTEFGVYELKYFFSEGLSTDSGEEISNKEVKAIIQSIIDREDKEKPLSDQKIAKMLEKRGFQIARRTVTKYREQLSIPVARLRKEIVLN